MIYETCSIKNCNYLSGLNMIIWYCLLDDYENEDDLVQYTVELYKKGEPLGITITGSEDSRLPISIQELSPGIKNYHNILLEHKKLYIKFWFFVYYEFTEIG